ncbi:TetR family transcriptional regulator [Mycobacterium asiaticum]|uniref:TetR family transcriptional regulator n=2 Tax=Mycobacteriaceae TaxID=1762 RepID=A0A1A3DJX8_MYCAS|nr:TetR family transcriptional regulator [Mycobacterium asiaticum]OBJ87806.1 TetR family transcriptional regulator [Mycobacterium asiaticum]
MSYPGTRTAGSVAILDAAQAVATLGGFKAVHFKAVAKQAGVTVGSVYEYFTSKTHLLVTLLTREFMQLDQERDWSTCAASPIRRLESLTRRLHEEWQQNVNATKAMVRAFVITGTDEALAAQQAADLFESMLARALSGGTEGAHERQIAGVIADIWLANLMAFVGGRATAEQTRECINGATLRVLNVREGTGDLKQY